jgi:hypothetical protein
MGSIMKDQKWDILTMAGNQARIVERSVSETQWQAMEGDRTLWRVPAGSITKLVSKVGVGDDGNRYGFTYIAMSTEPADSSKGDQRFQPILTQEHFWEEMEAKYLEIKTLQATWAADLERLTQQGINNQPGGPEPLADGKALDDQQDSPPPERWNVWVLDLVEMTCEIALSDVDLEEAADFKSVWTDTKSQVLILPTDFEIANREEQAGKLGAFASQLLDLSFGNTDDAKSSSRTHEAFHKAVVAGQ